MVFLPEERKKLLKVRYLGAKTISYLEAIGLDSFEQLKYQDPDFICSLIAHESGLPGWATHSLALRAIEGAIQCAHSEKSEKERESS